MTREEIAEEEKELQKQFEKDNFVPFDEDPFNEFEEEAYDPGMMFAYWFENLMAITGWRRLNFETQEVSRCYWDLYHERKRRR